MKTTQPSLISMSMFALALLSFGCSKYEKDVPEPEISVISENTTGGAPTIVGNIIENYYPSSSAEGHEEFDWENLEGVPLPPGTKFVPMPWSDKAKRQFSDDIRFDYKKSDGWELYFSTFSTHSHPGNLIFNLYNKYRGILRSYHFVGSGTENFRDYKILQNYVFSSEGSPLLNFTNQYIIDVNQNTTYSTSFEPQALADSSWYAVEYELAFDKDIYNKNAYFQMGSDFSMKKINSFIINGKETNELNAKVRVTESHGDIISADAYYILYGKKDISQMASSLSGSDLNHLTNLNEENILNGVLHTPSSMHIKWGTRLNVQLPPNGVGILRYSLPISGSDISSIMRSTPFYDRALGIFYLDRKPTYTTSTNTALSHPYQYTLDISSVEYLFNPSVLEIAEIKNLRQELVATEQEALIHDNNRANLFTGHILKASKPLHIQGVRVSFDVVPKDGGEKVHMIKTFRAEEQN
ncbi:hypothetical protein [Pontibacter pamirensis]|uniref:hypothetical protein n=1 Tax=Pontibacter pamirensis TaxID=2562824 RepID=UPI00138A4474|nr:hypothetical protein [Pontibacter pamirensis]